MKDSSCKGINLLGKFLSSDSVSLKICGVTTADDGAALIEHGVEALGVNFWPQSKRGTTPEQAAWLLPLAGKILRIGVFVNQPKEFAAGIFEKGMIDVVQLHGDECADEVMYFHERQIPLFKAIALRRAEDVVLRGYESAHGILLDAYAPGVYGGTGERVDWGEAKKFREQYPQIAMILAGGITPENAAQAASHVRPCALDVASGAELRPGVKDFVKVAALMKAVGSTHSTHVD